MGFQPAVKTGLSRRFNLVGDLLDLSPPVRRGLRSGMRASWKCRTSIRPVGTPSIAWLSVGCCVGRVASWWVRSSHSRKSCPSTAWLVCGRSDSGGGLFYVEQSGPGFRRSKICADAHPETPASPPGRAAIVLRRTMPGPVSTVEVPGFLLQLALPANARRGTPLAQNTPIIATIFVAGLGILLTQTNLERAECTR